MTVPPGTGAQVPASRGPSKPSKAGVLTLLREAAELEHQLMIQYLFAAYSLKTEPDDFPGDPDPVAKARRGVKWRDRVLEIAREEMGHLITVQQVILSLGGRPHFDRDCFPISHHFYPFQFALDPLTTTSIAKYLWTEKPREDAELTRDMLLGPDRADIEREVYPRYPNELGTLYEAIRNGIDLLPNGAFGSDAANQTDLARWPGLGAMAIVERITDQASARKAIALIVEQGEGDLYPKGTGHERSHFQKFLELYREFRDAVRSGEEPSRRIVTNPNTAGPNETGPDANRYRVLGPGRITAEPARRWAVLFNKRYAVLLAALAHAMTLPSSGRAGRRPGGKIEAKEGDPLPMLIRWARDEMTLVIAPIARFLTRLPVNDRPDSPRAGAPFELDGTGPSLGDDEKARWCAHQRLIDETRRIVELFRPGDDPLGILTAVQAIDRGRDDDIARQLTRVTSESREAADRVAAEIAVSMKSKAGGPQ